MKKRLIVWILVASVLLSGGVFAVVRSLNKTPPIKENADNIDLCDERIFYQNSPTEVKTLEYDFESTVPDKQPIKKQTVFIYKEPCKLSEKPELELYGSLGNNPAKQIKSVMLLDEAKEADINDFVFEGQIYYHGWVYFNLSERNIYYNGKVYKLNYDYTFFGEYFWKGFPKYEGDYKFGDPLPEHKFLSGTVIKIGKGYALKPLEDEPLSQLCEIVYPAFSGEVGKKVTIEYTGYVMAGKPAVIPFALCGYDYDPDFAYEKTAPEVLDISISSTMDYSNFNYDYEIDKYNTSSDANSDNGKRAWYENCKIIESIDEFAEYRGTYIAAFNKNYGEEFFKNNSLILIQFNKGTSSCDYMLRKLAVSEKSIHIGLYDKRDSFWGTTAIGYYIFSIAVPKSRTVECTKLIVNGEIKNLD